MTICVQHAVYSCQKDSIFMDFITNINKIFTFTGSLEKHDFIYLFESKTKQLFRRTFESLHIVFKVSCFLGTPCIFSKKGQTRNSGWVSCSLSQAENAVKYRQTWINVRVHFRSIRLAGGI